VLGGILGGWIAVEVSKPALGIRVPTGDGFAAPLAAALACGRVGCLLTGCCAGKAAAAGAWWQAIAVEARDGVSRFPAALVECVFHGSAAIVLVLLARRGVLRGRGLAAYVTAYCVLRIALEEVRDNPPVLHGWTYYQLLALPLLALAAATLARRSLHQRAS
jgi:prolipoprotein diacylglyceryltransferase